MFMLADDPHHMHADANDFYYFLVLSVILVVAVLFVGWKIMTFLERKRIPRGTNATTDKAEMAASAFQQSEENGSKK